MKNEGVFLLKKEVLKVWENSSFEWTVYLRSRQIYSAYTDIDLQVCREQTLSGILSFASLPEKFVRISVKG